MMYVIISEYRDTNCPALQINSPRPPISYTFHLTDRTPTSARS